MITASELHDTFDRTLRTRTKEITMVPYSLRLSVDGYVSLCDEMLREATADLLELEDNEFPLSVGDADWLNLALDQVEIKRLVKKPETG